MTDHPIRSYPDELRERAEADTDAIANPPIVGLAAPVCPEHQPDAECPCPPDCYCCQPEPAPAATEATDTPDTVTDPAWLREQYAAALLRAFDDQIIAEWICCEPINPGHKLCKNGETARKMVAGLLSDSDQDAYPSRILDALMTVRDRHLQQLRQRLELADADLDRYEEHVVGDLNEANIGLARQAARAEQQRNQLADVLADLDPAKLDLLADWFDTDDARKGPGRDIDVQADLRRWARDIRAALNPPKEPTP